MEFKVDFTIHDPGSGGRYRRPYVAVWIEDKDGFPVRTLVLGPNWKGVSLASGPQTLVQERPTSQTCR